MTEVTSYTELMAAIQAEVGAMGVRLLDFDALCDFPAGLSGKAFGAAQVRRLGPEKMFDALRGAGLKLRVEIDPDQRAKMLKRVAENFNPRQANQSRPNNHASPVGTALAKRVFKHLARKGGRARISKMSKEELRQHQKAAANARWKAYRKGLKAAHRRRRRNQQPRQIEGDGPGSGSGSSS